MTTKPLTNSSFFQGIIKEDVSALTKARRKLGIYAKIAHRFYENGEEIIEEDGAKFVSTGYLLMVFKTQADLNLWLLLRPKLSLYFGLKYTVKEK